ncbi:MAG: hypothetical protein HPZ86_05440 [Clostridia bacterium]|nr:hypothetical protein [Clostridia bacterium]
MVNQYRESKDQKTDYIELAHRLMEQYLNQKEPDLTMSQVRRYIEDIESVEDEVRRDCYEYVKTYEKCVLPYAAAQLFADRMYPVTGKIRESNDLAYEVFLDKILEDGTSVLHIDYPDFRKEMERRYKRGVELEKQARIAPLD